MADSWEWSTSAKIRHAPAPAVSTKQYNSQDQLEQTLEYTHTQNIYILLDQLVSNHEDQVKNKKTVLTGSTHTKNIAGMKIHNTHAPMYIYNTPAVLYVHDSPAVMYLHNTLEEFYIKPDSIHTASAVPPK